MSSTNGVVFFANKIYQNFTKSSAPTWEDEDGVLGGAAVDSLGDAVAATEVAFDILDTQRLTRIAIDSDDTHNTGNDAAATWRFDVDLNSLQDIDFAVTDNHDVRNAYDQEVKANIDIYHDANATFNGSTVLTPSKHFSGLIGKGRPRLDFDGVNNKLTISDAASLVNIFDHGGAAEFIIQARSDGEGDVGYIVAKDWVLNFKGESGGNVKTEFTKIFSGDNGTWISITADISINADHHIIVIYDARNTSNDPVIYVDNILETISESTPPTGNPTTDAGFDLILGNNSSATRTLDGAIQLGRIWNREPTSAEVSALYAGWTHTPIPVVDQGGSQANKVDAGDDNFNPGNIGDWVHATDTGNGTVLYEGTDPGAEKVGELTLGAVVGGFNQIRLNDGNAGALTVGEKYRATIRIYYEAGVTFSSVKVRCWDGTTNWDSEEYSGESTGTWFYGSVEFTAGNTKALLAVHTTGGATGDILYIDNIWLTRIGCVAEYHPDGINPGESKWYDSSSNNLDGTISGATEKDCPTAVNGKGDFTLYGFTAVLKQYWFWQFNLDNNTADTDTSIGQIGLGKKFDVALEPDLPLGEDHLYDGISLTESQGGRRSSNERYGRRLRWELNWSYIPKSEKANFETFFETIKGKMYPFWFTLNYNDNEPIFYWGRLINNPKFIPQADGVYSVNLIIEEEI